MNMTNKQLKNILMIHQHYFPEMTGTGRRTRELAEHFVKQGHVVTVVTSYPREFRSMPDIHCEPEEVLNGVNVFRIKTLFEVKNNVLLRMFSYLSFVIQSLKLAFKKSKECDIIISIAPISSGIIGAILQKITRKHHHFDVPDILPDLGISAGMIKNQFLIYCMYKLEKWVYDNSKTISAITYGQLENINNKGVDKNKLYFIPDWIDDSFFNENILKHKSKVSQESYFRDKRIISFVGNIGALQNPDIFLETMILLSKENPEEFRFLFIGDGIMLPELKEKVEKLKINNVEFVGRLKRELIPAYMNLSDVLVANYLPNEYMDICIPGKLFEYTISRKPIIMGARGEAKKMIEEYKLGLAVPPSDILEFKKAIIKITNSTFQFTPDTDRFVQDFSLPNVIDNYNAIFSQIN